MEIQKEWLGPTERVETIVTRRGGLGIPTTETYDYELYGFKCENPDGTHSCSLDLIQDTGGIVQHTGVQWSGGYVAEVEHYGSDKRIVEAARMSTGKGFLGWDPGPCPVCDGSWRILSSDQEGVICDCYACEGSGKVQGDMKLLAYLYSHRHDTPFEMAGLIIEVEAPIMVFREWHRHRTQSYNEMSARYAPLPNKNYIPSLARIMYGWNKGHLSANKQGKGSTSKEPDLAAAGAFQLALKANYESDEALYRHSLERGIPKELARVHLPVGRHSKMRASANLRNWLAFLTLRDAPDAQWEIRQCAKIVALMIERDFPRTYELFCKGRKS